MNIPEDNTPITIYGRIVTPINSRSRKKIIENDDNDSGDEKSSPLKNSMKKISESDNDVYQKRQIISPAAPKKRSPNIVDNTSKKSSNISPKLPIIYENENVKSLNIPDKTFKKIYTDGRPKYDELTKTEQDHYRISFTDKFMTLKTKYKEFNTIIPPDHYTLDQIHDSFENQVKLIITTLNCSQWKIYLVILFLIIECTGKCFLGLNFTGFTKSQLRIMSRYDSLMVELGINWSNSEKSNLSPEAKILLMAGINGLIFVAVKYLCNWIGSDSMADTIQDGLDKILNCGTISKTVSDVDGITKIPEVESAIPSTGVNMITDMFGKVMNGDIDIGGIIDKVTTAIGGNKNDGNSVVVEDPVVKKPQARKGPVFGAKRNIIDK
jgi:hypothetical protein